MKKLTLIVFFATLTCFCLSYATAKIAGLRGEKDLALSLLERYNLAANPGVPVDLHRNFDQEGPIEEIEINTISTDIVAEPVESGPVETWLEGTFRPEDGDPDHALLSKYDHGKLTLKVEDKAHEGGFIQMNFRNLGGKLHIGIPLSTKKLTIKTVSGDISARGSALDWTLHSVSGNQNLQPLNSAPALSSHAVSGDVHIHFFQAPNVTLGFRSISGDFQAPSGWGTTETTGHISHFKAGTGNGQIEVKTVSGNLSLTHE